MAISGETDSGAAGAAAHEQDELARASAVRRQRANRYFDEDLRGQRKWYSARAGRQKGMHVWLSFVVLAAGAATAVTQLFAPASPDHAPGVVPIITALLGTLVVVAKGVERIWRFEDTWAGYRKASEAMKHEYRVYVNATGPYQAAADEEVRYKLLVERVERIVAEEQGAFWGRREEEDAPTPETGGST
jgi:hypothetical protein